eukprot:6196383-Pleurochrysis_carterae.AAC.1
MVSDATRRAGEDAPTCSSCCCQRRRRCVGRYCRPPAAASKRAHLDIGRAEARNARAHARCCARVWATYARCAHTARVYVMPRVLWQTLVHVRSSLHRTAVRRLQSARKEQIVALEARLSMNGRQQPQTCAAQHKAGDPIDNTKWREVWGGTEGSDRAWGL